MWQRVDISKLDVVIAAVILYIDHDISSQWDRNIAIVKDSYKGTWMLRVAAILQKHGCRFESSLEHAFTAAS